MFDIAWVDSSSHRGLSITNWQRAMIIYQCSIATPSKRLALLN
jgi:hypothetical protein